MFTISRLIVIFSFVSSTFTCANADYKYELIKNNNHVIHIVTIDPNEYELSLVSAHDQVFGRERVGEIAERKLADIAINAGFFEIGNNEDGRPSGTLIINGKVFGLMKPEHACFIKKNEKFSVEMLKPKVDIEIDNMHFNPYRFNRFISGKKQGVYFYTRSWGPSSLSPYNRKELVLNSEKKITMVSNFGDNKIPENGYLISFPPSADLSQIKIGAMAKFHWTPPYLADSNTSAILGIPMLILDGKISDGLENKSQHARTAIGIKANGELIILVAEHAYNETIKSMTVEKVRKIIKEKELPIENLTIDKLMVILTDYLKVENAAIGLTLQELAQLLKDKNCVSAINLDGGGSSTLYIAGKYVNQTIGDVDEGLGQNIVRPVSDAIIFKKEF